QDTAGSGDATELQPPCNSFTSGIRASRLLRAGMFQPGVVTMARSSISGADRAPTQAQGRDVEALGPSDTSDSGSDVQGELELAPPIDLDNPSGGSVHPGWQSDSDAAGTGERGAALLDEEAREGGDILPDQITDM